MLISVGIKSGLTCANHCH